MEYLACCMYSMTQYQRGSNINIFISNKYFKDFMYSSIPLGPHFAEYRAINVFSGGLLLLHLQAIGVGSAGYLRLTLNHS